MPAPSSCVCVCVCVRAHSAHVRVIFNACTSHIHRGPSWSFISPLYPPLPLMWETQESDGCCSGEWNTVDLCSPHQGRGLPLIRCIFVVSFILCPLPSITHSNSSQTSPTSPTSIANPLLSSSLMRPVLFSFFSFFFVKPLICKLSERQSALGSFN